MEESSHKRIVAFDYLKAIAIVLVVIGHWHPDNSPTWWQYINRFIYSFHMPVFLAASGFLYAYTREPQSYRSFIANKFKRLMIPYFSVSLVIICIKLVSGTFFNFENPVTPHAFISVFYLPSAGFFLWFLWALWWFFLIIPFFKTKKSRLILFLISVILAYMPYKAPEFMCLKQAQIMLIYFVIGILSHDYKHIFKWIINLKTPVALSILFLCEILYLGYIPNLKYLTPFIGIAAMLNLSFAIERQNCPTLSKTLFQLGINSFGIYLFHTTFEGFAKSFIAKLCPILVNPDSTMAFAIGSVIIVTIGVIMPLVLYKYCINRFKFTRIIFGGYK